MSDFRKLAREGRWDEVNWIWLDPTEQAEFLDMVRKKALKIRAENGIERNWRYALPHEVESDRAQIALAKILELGELEASVEGEPPIASQAWHDLLKQVEPLLQIAMTEPEVTEGTPELSRRAHANAASEYLAEVARIPAFLAPSMDTEDEMRWLVEVVAEVATAAFMAGYHTRTAWGKAFELDAVKGEKGAGGSRNRAHQTNLKFVKPRAEILARIDELRLTIIDGKPMKVSKAIAQCAVERSTSYESVSRIWYRYRKV